MPVVRHFLGGEHRDRSGADARVERLHQPEGGDRARDIDMRAHRGGMDPGVGAPGGLHRHRLAGDRERGFLQRLLDARAVRLPLPAHERAAVEFDRQRESGHRIVPGVTVKPRSNSCAGITPRPARWTRVGRIAPPAQAIVS